MGENAHGTLLDRNVELVLVELEERRVGVWLQAAPRQLPQPWLASHFGDNPTAADFAVAG